MEAEGPEPRWTGNKMYVLKHAPTHAHVHTRAPDRRADKQVDRQVRI